MLNKFKDNHDGLVEVLDDWFLPNESSGVLGKLKKAIVADLVELYVQDKQLKLDCFDRHVEVGKYDLFSIEGDCELIYHVHAKDTDSNFINSDTDVMRLLAKALMPYFNNMEYGHTLALITPTPVTVVDNVASGDREVYNTLASLVKLVSDELFTLTFNNDRDAAGFYYMVCRSLSIAYMSRGSKDVDSMLMFYSTGDDVGVVKSEGKSIYRQWVNEAIDLKDPCPVYYAADKLKTELVNTLALLPPSDYILDFVNGVVIEPNGKWTEEGSKYAFKFEHDLISEKLDTWLSDGTVSTVKDTFTIMSYINIVLNLSIGHWRECDISNFTALAPANKKILTEVTTHVSYQLLTLIKRFPEKEIVFVEYSPGCSSLLVTML